MKKFVIAASVALVATSFVNPSYALNTEHKRELSVGGSALVGALLAGPVGYVIGAVGGVVMAEQIKQADDSAAELAQLNQQYDVLAEATETTSQLLEEANEDVESLSLSLLAQAQTPVFFATGSDQLSVQELEKISKAVAVLQRDKSATITLHGYADPRGTDGYNLVLSEYRALAVKQALVANGVDEHRISSAGHGEATPASDNNAATYALARRVEISLESNLDNGFVMQ